MRVGVGVQEKVGAASRVSRPGFWVVADRPVVRLLRRAGLDADVTTVSPVELTVDGAVPPGGVVVVADGASHGRGELAAAVARWAPYRRVVVLVADVPRLLDLHAEYLAVAARDPRCDPRARVQVLVGTVTAQRLRRVLSPHLEQPATTARVTSLPAGPGAPARPSPYALLRTPARGRTVVVQGCAGGVGASTIALTVAAGVTRRTPTTRVCVVGALPCAAARSVDVHAVADRGPQWLPGPNVHLLPAVAASELGSADVPALVDALHRRFDVVILDRRASLPLPAPTLPIDRVLLVTTLAAPSLAGLGRYAAALRDRAELLDDAAAPTVRVIVNGALNGVGVKPQQVVDAALGAPIVAAVPSAVRDATIATNTGQVHRLLDHPDLGPVYLRLAEHVVPVEAREPATAAAPDQRPRRRRQVRHPVQPAAVARSPFVVEHADGLTAR